MKLNYRHLAYPIAAAFIGLASAAYAQAPATATDSSAPAGSTYACPHPTTAARDQYGCVPKLGGGGARAQVNNPIDPNKKR